MFKGRSTHIMSYTFTHNEPITPVWFPNLFLTIIGYLMFLSIQVNLFIRITNATLQPLHLTPPPRHQAISSKPMAKLISEFTK